MRAIDDETTWGFRLSQHLEPAFVRWICYNGVVRVSLVVIFVSFVALDARADGSGFTVAAGAGPAFGGVGVSVGVTFMPAEIVHLAPYVGGGMTFISPNDDLAVWGGAAGGLVTSLGRRHRLMLDVSFGSTQMQRLTFYGYDMVRRTWGVSALLGYEFATSTGFTVRAGIGPQLQVTPPTPEISPWSLASVIAVGKTF